MKKIILLSLLLLAAFSLASSAQEVGCCTNPQADRSFICTSGQDGTGFVASSQCCPAGINQQQCLSSYFFKNTPCGTVQACQTQGCCCSSTPAAKTTQAECPISVVQAPEGQSCNSVCGVSQCLDQEDNDNDNCIDAADPDCQLSNKETNKDSACIDVSSLNCNHREYPAKITSMSAKQVRGQKKVELQWQNECTQNLVSHDIYRCEGSNCQDFALLESTSSGTYIDDSTSLKFSTLYRYKVVSHYSLQSATPSAMSTVQTGSPECINRLDSSFFCLAQQNAAFFCDSNNRLVEQGTSCSSNEACVISNNNPTCIEKSECNIPSSKPFGMFSDKNSCIKNGNLPRYCFYDRSTTVSNSCSACSAQMSCYSYKSKDSCETDSCFIGSCLWRSLSDELGTGVCISQTEDNCKYCDVQQSDASASSKVFEQCTPEKAQKLSFGDNICVSNNQKGTSCAAAICTDYASPQCTDTCNLGICRNFNGICKKDGNNDNTADCSQGNETCEKDVYAPITTMVPIIENGRQKELVAEVLDKSSGSESYARKTPGNHTIYLCNENIPSSCNNPSKTQRFSFRIFNLEIYDLGVKIIDLAEGQNTIRYYAEDPSKNIGEKKTIIVNAASNSSGPVLIAETFSVSDAKKVGNAYYTQNLRPTISFSFLKESQLTLARLVPEKNPQLPAFLNSSSIFAKSYQLTPQKNLDLGNYVFELNAKGANNLFMDSLFKAPVIIDNKKPSITNVEPRDILIKDRSQIPITIVFDEKVNIDSISISGQESKQFFSTTDSITYKATINLADGNKEIKVKATDFAGNAMENSSYFILNAVQALKISTLDPRFGVSPTYTFRLIIGTDNDAECKYALDLPGLSFANMNAFDSTQKTNHTKSSVSIPDGDRSIHKLYVKCIDSEYKTQTEASFDLSVDNARPKIVNAFASPNPVAEVPRQTTLKVQSDKETVCRFSRQASTFELMEGKFPGFDENSFSASHLSNFTVEADGRFDVFTVCRAKSGLLSETGKISFSSDSTLHLSVTSTTPKFFNTTTASLSVETSKQAQCFYGPSEQNMAEQMAGNDYGHSKSLILPNGNHKYLVMCVSRSETSQPISIEFAIDTTAPEMVFVDDTSTLQGNPEYTWRTDKLPAKWLGRDNDTGIISYIYTLEEFGTLRTIVNWTTTVKENEWVLLPETGLLNLSSGSKYVFRFRAKNTLGLFSDALGSNGISVDINLKPTDCSNKVKDPLESDIDCGGPCGSCLEGRACRENFDCASSFCSANVCKAATCEDTARNQDESDADCGGNSCSSCGNGKKCNVDSDCASSFCSFGTCSTASLCSDGILSGTETDIDCGGSCSSRCAAGQTCQSDSDCSFGILCLDSKCSSQEEDPNKDSDNDGIPDRWELEQGLDPNDPSDSGMDFDNDTLTNLQEYSKLTNPNSADTDKDGYSDKKEIDKGTDPLDPESRPGSFFMTLLLILLLIGILGGAGYGVYHHYHKSLSPVGMQPRQRILPYQKPMPKPQPKPKTTDLFAKRENEKKEKRSEFFEAFGKAAEKKVQKEEKPQPEKPKEKRDDDFSRLKAISSGKTQPRPKAVQKDETMSKLREIAKKPGKGKK